MVNFVETLIAITVIAALIAILAWIQSRAGGERKIRYRRRMRNALAVMLACGALATALEIYIRR
jgi:hypothetical protein